jgi:diacylglycerol kinase
VTRPKQSFARSFRCALRGIFVAVVTERNLKIQLVVAVAALLAGVLLTLTPFEWCLLIVLIALILAAELLNSAIETTIDLICPEHDERARLAKDAAAGAVLLLAVCAVLCGGVIYTQALLRLLGTSGA